MSAPDYMQHEKPNSYRYRTLTGDEKFIADRWEEAETLAESSNPNSCYDFDDYALIRIGEEYFVTNASGCSCPSHEEVWEVEKRGTVDDILSYVSVDSSKAGEAFREFQREVHKVWDVVPNPPVGAKYDW